MVQISSCHYTSSFLETGDIYITMVDETENFDNYDRVLKKIITAEEKDIITQKAQYYVSLHKKYKDDDNLTEDEDARYNLYTHNCDTVAGKILNEIDADFFYVHQEWKLHQIIVFMLE